MSENTAPWYARAVSAVGRQAVLLAALAMSAPGEYHLAVLAGWSGWVAALMPLCLSVYAAAAAAVMAATRPAGASGRRSVVIGVGCALVLALAAQVTAHLIAAGFTATSVGMRSSVIGRTRPSLVLRRSPDRDDRAVAVDRSPIGTVAAMTALV